MSKAIVKFFCKDCGHVAPKWLGKCPSCEAWNSFTEEVVQKSSASSKPLWGKSNGQKSAAIKIHEIIEGEEQRFALTDNELNRVLGGGLVSGSITLIGGEPGIGKSTLLLQLALQIKRKVLYVSGEESETQIKMRAERIGIVNDQCYVICETSLGNLLSYLKSDTPEILIVDSIQTLSSDSIDSPPGSISQIKECTAELLRFAKESNVPVFLIGHINKDGNIAGPKVLEHMVDTVLQFEGDRNHVYRILRSLKNRFGSTSELGIYEMQGSGLREVSNPSEILISHREEELSGTAIASTLEGMRPLMIEIQALVSTAVYGTPQRSTTGYNVKRLNMILAVLEKRAGFRLGTKDVFLNITGGISVDDPAIDLAVVAAILSSNEDITVSKNACFAGEVGLSGEIRPVNRVEQRIQEAEKLGFSTIYISKYNKIAIKFPNIKVILVSKIEEIAEQLFG